MKEIYEFCLSLFTERNRTVFKNNRWSLLPNFELFTFQETLKRSYSWRNKMSVGTTIIWVFQNENFWYFAQDHRIQTHHAWLKILGDSISMLEETSERLWNVRLMKSHLRMFDGQDRWSRQCIEFYLCWFVWGSGESPDYLFGTVSGLYLKIMTWKRKT